MNSIVGRPRFQLERVHVPRPPFFVTTNCIVCREMVVVDYGQAFAVFRVGNEIVGVSCDDCLDSHTLDALARFRERTVR